LGVGFDSFTEKSGLFRLLGVRDSLVLPINMKTQLLITSHDVIHSFALPSLGVKVDANPGRLNSSQIECRRPGCYFGQCRELCGSLHSNIRINVEVVSALMFREWVSKMRA